MVKEETFLSGRKDQLSIWRVQVFIYYCLCELFIFHVSDISKTSVETCEQRYSTGRMLDRSRKPPFEAEFIVADCCEVRSSISFLPLSCSLY